MAGANPVSTAQLPIVHPEREPSVGTISNSTFVSLDGVINHMEQWHFEFVDDESNDLALQQIKSATGMLMGRHTYEVYANVWPGRDGDYADAINAIPKYVASNTLNEPTWQNTTVLTRGLIECVRELRNRQNESILMHGFGPVAKSLLAADLLDELHLWVHPHFAGVGGPADVLFEDGLNKRLQLAGTRTLRSGVVVMTFTQPDA
jgi:dihydrofolate reductase